MEYFAPSALHSGRPAVKQPSVAGSPIQSQLRNRAAGVGTSIIFCFGLAAMLANTLGSVLRHATPTEA